MEEHIFDINESSSDLLLSKLLSIQKKYGYCPEKQLKKLSEKENLPLTKIYEVVTFYSFLDTEPQGRHVIRICHSPSCYLNGSENMIDSFKDILGISPGETTDDKRFSLKMTSCIGCCNESPAALIDGKTYTKLTKNKLKEILSGLD